MDNSYLTLELIENISSYEFVDKIAHDDKHGILFKEHIYSPDVVYSTFAVKLVHGVNKNKKEKMLLASPGKRKESMSQSGTEFDLKDFLNDEKKKVIVEIFNKDKELIYSDTGFNQIIVKNVNLEGYPYIPAEPENPVKRAKDRGIYILDSYI